MRTRIDLFCGAGQSWFAASGSAAIQIQIRSVQITRYFDVLDGWYRERGLRVGTGEVGWADVQVHYLVDRPMIQLATT